MSVAIAESWKEHLSQEFEKPYFKKLMSFVRDEHKAHKVYPPGPKIFNAFEKCSFENTKVVVIGQDPYHGPGQANGLSFSVNDGVPKPPSLVNIFKELHDEIGKPIPESGNLESWAEQGVLMLNAVLTVRHKSPGSHTGKGWEQFTDAVIRVISEEKTEVVFMLWGRYAQEKGASINKDKHLVLSSPHPSPFSARRGFFGNGHFLKANEYLKDKGLEPVRW